jgi:hypothetical protein
MLWGWFLLGVGVIILAAQLVRRLMQTSAERGDIMRALLKRQRQS